jgi:hypothetical protein
VLVTPWALFAGQYLCFFDQCCCLHHLWSSGSDALVLPVLGEGGMSKITLFGVDGSVRELVPGDMPAWSPR